MNSLDKTEYVKALRAERETLCAQLADLESRLDNIDAEIRQNTPPPDVTKMTPLERAMYEDQLLRHQVVQAMAKSSPFLNILDGGVFPKGL